MGESPPTAQSLEAYSSNDTVPAMFPPADALTVAESRGTHVCAVVIDDGTELTTTFSLVSLQVVLWSVELLFGRLPLYSATQWYVPVAAGANWGFGVLYVPSPDTVTAADVYLSVPQPVVEGP
jgi:hypothetical protein